MKKTLLLTLFLLTGCTVYTEKQSEALSRNVYATKDSLDNARVDLAVGYINQVTQLVKPPKKRIKVDAIYTDDSSETTPVQKSKAKKTIRTVKFGTHPSTNKLQVVTLPESYKGFQTIVVNSVEYQKLLEDKKLHDQLKWDYYNLDEQKKTTELEVIKQKDMNNKMINDLNSFQKQVYKLRYEVLIRDIIIALLLAGYGLWLYIKITKPLSFIP